VATSFTKDGNAGGLWSFLFRWLGPLLLLPEAGAPVGLLGDIARRARQEWCVLRASSRSATDRDDAAAERLWEVTEALVARLSEA